MPGAENAVDTVTSGLLSNAREGDAEAWELLVEIYSPVIFVWCRQRGLSPHQAQDVGQETWVSVWSNLSVFRRSAGQHAFRRWLFTIVRNKIIDMHRRLKELVLDTPENVPFAIHEPDSEDNSNVNVIFSQIVRWISTKYREHNWKAFLLCYTDNLDRDDVARVLGLTRNQVDLACSRILRALKNEFGNTIVCGDKTVRND
ncbi:MAG: sigma-70 family RNA polymerase sigma factor [Pirellulaceae bacterium]